jgi:hypothetical protein
LGRAILDRVARDRDGQTNAGLEDGHLVVVTLRLG